MYSTRLLLTGNRVVRCKQLPQNVCADMQLDHPFCKTMNPAPGGRCYFIHSALLTSFFVEQTLEAQTS
jgi:hypothetical protein